ncbi:MAG: LysR substrate-binding domain-containing protein [Alphaproteobacteria bacterium]
MPTLRQFSYLVALADESHFGRAARRLNVTQPTLSAQVAALERKLDADLVERGRGPVALTPLGREVANRARSVLTAVHDITQLCAAAPDGLAGTIRLGVPATLGPYLLPHLVPALHAAYPDLRLHVREGKRDFLRAELLAGRFDLLLTPLPVSVAGATEARLFREPLLVVAPPDHRLAGRGEIARADLTGEFVLGLEPGHHLHDQVRGLCERFGATLLRDFEGTSLDTLRQMVAMGAGLAFLPALYVRSEIGARGEVAVLRLARARLERHIGMAWRTSSSHDGHFRALADLIRRVARKSLPEVRVDG